MKTWYQILLRWWIHSKAGSTITPMPTTAKWVQGYKALAKEEYEKLNKRMG